MATVQIRRRGNGKIIFEHTCEGNSVKVTLEHGVETGIYFADADLDGARLDGASLDGARLDGASLVGARLDGASLDGASLVGARLDGASLDGASLVGASLVGARLDGASLDGASLVGASLDGASLDGVSLADASLVGASLDGASLDGASLVGARLVGARLVGARLDVRVPPTGSHDFIAEILLRENHKYSREVAGIVLISRDWCWADFLNYFSKSKIAWAKQVLCSKWSVFEKKFGVK